MDQKILRWATFSTEEKRNGHSGLLAKRSVFGKARGAEHMWLFCKGLLGWYDHDTAMCRRLSGIAGVLEILTAAYPFPLAQ